MLFLTMPSEVPTIVLILKYDTPILKALFLHLIFLCIADTFLRIATQAWRWFDAIFIRYNCIVFKIRNCAVEETRFMRFKTILSLTLITFLVIITLSPDA